MSNIKGGVILFLVATIVCLLVWYIYSAGKRSTTEIPIETLVSQLPDSPSGALYQIEGNEVQLVDGYAEAEVVPGSATKAVTQIYGEVIEGELAKDSNGDAALLLTHQEGGSGTFFYVAAAVQTDGGYFGTNTIFLGDRIEPRSLSIFHKIVKVDYLTQGNEEALSEEPTTPITRYFTVSGLTLKEVGPLAQNEKLFVGELVYGHESHTFKPCGGEAVWIAPSSRAEAAVQAVYLESTKEEAPYTPLMVALTGTLMPGLTDGFAADFGGAIEIEHLVHTLEDGVCLTEEPLTTSPEDIE